ncbi:MAG: cation diffusion facilitator family transporter [Paludibacteraceae bacterium]|nr:cation diffusion facilitator family transporter [Paludibacteraceae bacterium]
MTREREIAQVTLWGGLANGLLVVGKFIAGIWGHSAAMVADALHSLSDLLTDIVVVVFVHISAKPQDESHDYGHGKYETIAAFLIAVALFAAAVGIIVSGAQRMAAWWNGADIAAPHQIALWMALISIAVKEALYQYTIRRSQALESPALKANAWHHRSDALSSIGSALGIAGAILLGNRWTVLDPLASVVVGAMLIKTSIDLLRGSINELTESSLPAETEQEICSIVYAVNGLTDLHNLRTRRIGKRIAIEMHVRMDGNTTLREAHDKTKLVEQQLRQRFGESTHVNIHMEPIKKQ